MNRQRLAEQGLYVITDPQLIGRELLLPAVAAALRGGAGMVQYRDKGTDQSRREKEARALLKLCQAKGVPLIINDDLALAVEIGADGIHLGAEDIQPAEARAQLGPNAIIGISGYSNANAAANPLADYVAFGRFYPSATKPDASPAAPEVLGQARALTDKPLVAIGGINVNNAACLLRAGANWLAVIHSVFAGPDIEHNARMLCHVLQQRI